MSPASSRPLSTCLLLLLLFASAIRAEEDRAEYGFGESTLTFTVPDLEGLEHDQYLVPSAEDCWAGEVDGSKLVITLRSRGLNGSTEPEVLALDIGRAYASKDGGDPEFAFQSFEVIRGPFGAVPYACLATGLLPSRTKPVGETIVLGGLLEEDAYSIVVEATPRLKEGTRKKILTFLRKGVKAESVPRSAEWTKEEVRERWDDVVTDPKVRAQLTKPVITKHYIVLTNSSAGGLFAKKMEGYYKRVQRTFSFPEVKERKRMPVFLFRMKDEYMAFCDAVGMLNGRQTKGHAWKDYYATWYESPNDPVHIHEATHQIFFNRLFLRGGCSWFQEGVAEYMCTTAKERKALLKPLAAANRNRTILQMISMPALSGAAKPHEAYLQAAAWIQFLRDGGWHSEKFPGFLIRFGQIPHGNVEVMRKVFKQTYGTELHELETKFVSYWKTR